jgi:hypothetical protein
MNNDILIHSLREAFDKAINAAVDARLTALLQSYANTTAQFVTDIDNLKQRVAALELRMPLNTDLNKIKELIDNRIEEALDAHASTYDHDRYDSVCDEFENNSQSDLESAVRDALREATFSVEVSL